MYINWIWGNKVNKIAFYMFGTLKQATNVIFINITHTFLSFPIFLYFFFPVIFCRSRDVLFVSHF